MGALVGRVCHADAQSAHDALFSSVVPTQSYSAGSGYAVSTLSYADRSASTAPLWNMCYSKTDELTGTVVSACHLAPVPALPTCDLTAPFFDGMAIGWGIAGAIVLVVGIKMMIRAARGSG